MGDHWLKDRELGLAISGPELLTAVVGLGDITWFSQVGYGGGAGCGVVGQAAMAVATGQCTVAVAWRARKR